MNSNQLKVRLRAGQTAVGPVCVLGSIESIELACAAGFDFVLVDGQHGSFNRDQIRESVRAIEAMNGNAVARPPSDAPDQIQALLDMGYLSLLVPMVNTAGQAQAVVEASIYPPLGQRSQASTRASIRNGPDYRAKCNDQVFLMAMIETVEAAKNIQSIAETAGIDCCFIGGTDLASSMNIPPRGPRPPSYEQAIEAVLNTTLAAGKIPAIATGSSQEARHRIEQGFQLVTLGTDLRHLAGAYEIARKASSQA